MFIHVLEYKSTYCRRFNIIVILLQKSAKILAMLTNYVCVIILHLCIMQNIAYIYSHFYGKSVNVFVLYLEVTISFFIPDFNPLILKRKHNEYLDSTQINQKTNVP